MSPGDREKSAAVALGLALVATAVTLALHHPVLPLARTHVPVSAFHPGHVFIFDHIARMVTGDAPWSLVTERLAYPVGAELRPIAWVPALLTLPFRPLLGPIGAYNAVVWMSPALSALAAWGLIRRLTGAGPLAAAGAALPFALSPFALGCLASGQTAKVQLWALALPLWAASVALERPRLGLPLLAGTVVAASFTSPSLTLQLPFALGLVALGGLSLGWRGAARGAGALGVAALSMLPAYLFFRAVTGGHDPDGPVQALQPALRPTLMEDIGNAIARLRATLLPFPELPVEPTDTAHLTVLPWPILVVALLALPWSRKGRWIGLGLAIAGFLLASGEYLWWAEGFVEVGGHLLGLPALYLGRLGYPLSDSGMYYRAIATTTLGLSILLAAAAARVGGRRGALLAVLVGLAATAEAVRVTAPLWPRAPYAPIPAALAARMAEDPVPGAVLDLPMEHHGNHAEGYMLAAVQHGRATIGAPLLLRPEDLPHLAALERDVVAALEAEDPDAALRALGFRYVVWHPIGWDGGPGEADVAAALGPGTLEEGVRWWRVEGGE
ncbi:MAG: hypothetical protein H6739_12335 [Alphaproteobacteria bacterium]|nr:hypothetical protein [Alphaproteobacteria bacterium]